MLLSVILIDYTEVCLLLIKFKILLNVINILVYSTVFKIVVDVLTQKDQKEYIGKILNLK